MGFSSAHKSLFIFCRLCCGSTDSFASLYHDDVIAKLGLGLAILGI